MQLMNKYLYYNNIHICIGLEESETTQNQEIELYIPGPQETLKNAIDNFMKEGNNKNLLIKTTDVESAFEEVKKYFKYIIAAGGLIVECAGGRFWHEPIAGAHKLRMIASNGLLHRYLPIPV